jgi:hypothetical protein
VPVTLENRERSVFELVEAVVSQVRRATGIAVGLGTVPVNLLVRTQAILGAKSEPARDVLIRAFGATGQTLSWHLLCDPGATKMCALNVHVVPARK